MKLRFLSLLAFSLLASASAVTVSGSVDGATTPDMRLSAWAVKVSGQPSQELTSAALKDGTFSLTLPAAAPANLYPIDDRIAWPGLLDFGKASANAQAAEVKFFVYRDANGNGSRDEGEALREVRLNAGKALVFVAWASSDVSVTGSNGYQADLNKGWNVLSVEVRSTVKIAPFDTKTPVQVTLSK